MALNEELSSLFFDFSNRRYWFIRTDGGRYYEDFESLNFIAIDNDNITLSEIVEARRISTKSRPAQKIIGDLIVDRNPDATFQNVHAKAILDFCFNMKKGDVVFIPDDGDILRFGIIQNNKLHIERRTETVPFTFHRDVHWFERKRRRELGAEIWPLFHTQKTVNNADKYADLINPALNSLYQTESRAHLSLDVTATGAIDAATFFNFGLNILELEKEITEYFKTGETAKQKDDKVEVKVEVRSPGTIELIAMSVGGLAILGIIIVGLAGGKWKVHSKGGGFEFKGEVETNSILDKLNNFFNGTVERKNKLLEIQRKSKELGISDKRGDIARVLGMFSEEDQSTLEKKPRKRRRK